MICTIGLLSAAAAAQATASQSDRCQAPDRQQNQNTATETRSPFGRKTEHRITVRLQWRSDAVLDERQRSRLKRCHKAAVNQTELEPMMSPHDEKAAAFEWIVPDDGSDVRHLSVDGNYVGSIARNTENPSAQNQWSWRVTIPDSVDRDTPLARQADDEQAARKAAEDAYARARRENM
jgi:hypothetical protein